MTGRFVAARTDRVGEAGKNKISEPIGDFIRRFLFMADTASHRLVDVVESDVRLKREGNRWKGLCPFHQEKTPSFFVYEENRYFCYGCGAKGDLIDYLREKRGMSFFEACEVSGKDLKPREPTVEEKEWLKGAMVLADTFHRVMNIQKEKNGCRDSPSQESRARWLTLNSTQKDLIEVDLARQMAVFQNIEKPKSIPKWCRDMLSLRGVSGMSELFVTGTDTFRETIIGTIKGK